MEWLKNLPGWVGALGWLALLAGFLLQRKAQQSRLTQSNKASVFGSSNSVVQANHGHAQPGSTAQGAANPPSALETLANWATIAGLFVSLLPVVKDLLDK